MRQRILIADSSKAVRAMYQACLQEQGYDVQTVECGEDVLRLLDKRRFDMVILGTELADTDSRQLCRQIKCRQEYVLTPIIIVSSNRSVQLKLDSFNAGATDFLLKNCTPHFLTERIDSILKRQQVLQFNSHLAGQRFRVLVAEDSPSLRALYQQLLSVINCEVISCEHGKEAWQELRSDPTGFDLVITDLEMPEMTGEELAHLIRANSRFDDVPIIIITQFDQQESLCNLLSKGADDYIAKPFTHEEFSARVRAHLRSRYQSKEHRRLNDALAQMNDRLEQRVVERTQELFEANLDTVEKLAQVCNFRDRDTGHHIQRVRLYVEELAGAVGLDDNHVRQIGYSSMMHDVGKVSTPDDILNKPGPLDADEWHVMRKHTVEGATILGDKPFFKMAREIALYHHERFDGTGYPYGLSGAEIPLAARLVSVVDVFDALMSKRSYKHAWSLDETIAELRRVAGTHLDPALTELFIELQLSGKLDYIRQDFPIIQEDQR